MALVQGAHGRYEAQGPTIEERVFGQLLHPGNCTDDFHLIRSGLGVRGLLAEIEDQVGALRLGI
jgi:hypothetical protein